MKIKKNILLLEPGYKNKYPPLGLMKLAQYHRKQNKSNRIIFAKGENDPVLTRFNWDRIYITTLFSFEWRKTAKCIDRALELMPGKQRKIFVGGISASLMREAFHEEERWRGIRFIQGILKEPPAISLGLNGRDFGYKDITSTPIDELVPDYGILEQIEYKYPVNDAYFGYASRGCIRKCSFCGVPKLEGGQKDMPPISTLVNSVSAAYGEKKDLVLMDNNVTAAPKFNEIIAEIRDLGFTPGAKLSRNGRWYKRRVDFNQGVDSRLLSQNENLLKQLSSICISPLRIAFDHWGVKKHYELSVRQAAEHGITSLSNYMLYNFHDNPEDLYRRLVLNIELNSSLDVRIWSFPMRYQPVTMKDRSFVGKRWNRYFLRSFQIILQATHGVVSGNPSFFNHAFGSSVDKFLNLLSMPHEFIFNREYYLTGDGMPVFDEFKSKWNALTSDQRVELITYLSGPEDQIGLKPSKFSLLLTDGSIDRKVRDIVRFYAAYGSAKSIGDKLGVTHKDLIVPADEKVEDAGLYESESMRPLLMPIETRRGDLPLKIAL